MRFKGELLRKLRKENGYSQKELGAVTNISRDTILKYEQGRRVPGLFNVFKLAYVLDVYIEDFIEFEEEELPDIWVEDDEEEEDA